MNAIIETNFSLPGQTQLYKGKVRDVYSLNDYLLIVASDRISAFDTVLPRPIPFKGQILNQIAARNMSATKEIVPNWLIATPDPNVSIGILCQPYPIEMVIRGYLSGHAWREYHSGKRTLCGVSLPNGLSENDRLPEPIITPTTKNNKGHDEDISREEIINQEIILESEYIKLEQYTKALFKKGTEMASAQGLILVDTKYEFGLNKGIIYLIDELHTPDSSRYFYSSGYEKRQSEGLPQKQLSKEFVRQWLISKGFQGIKGETLPTMTDSKVEEISNYYIHLYSLFMNSPFVKPTNKPLLLRVEENILNWLKINKKKNRTPT